MLYVVKIKSTEALTRNVVHAYFKYTRIFHLTLNISLIICLVNQYRYGSQDGFSLHRTDYSVAYMAKLCK